MTPKDFEEKNVVFGANQSEYEPLPVCKFDSGEVVSCWNLSWKELWRVIRKREIWLSVQTFNSPLQPVFVSARKEEVIVHDCLYRVWRGKV